MPTSRNRGPTECLRRGRSMERALEPLPRLWREDVQRVHRSESTVGASAPGTAACSKQASGNVATLARVPAVISGLTITEDGKLTGTPTETGNWDFWVALDDNSGPHNPFCQVPSPQSHVRPLTYSVAIGSLPSGLALNATTGAVRGVPRVAGIFGLTFVVTDSAGQQSTVPANLRIAARLAIRTGRLPAASLGSAYRARLATRGGLAPKLWRVSRGALPRGIRLNAANGTLTGTPRQAGVFRITVEARDRLGARSTKTLRLTVTG